jgi:hypothetical protein
MRGAIPPPHYTSMEWCSAKAQGQLYPFARRPTVAECRKRFTNRRFHITIILPLVLYGYDKWSDTLREEHSWKVFEKRFLRRIFVP